MAEIMGVAFVFGAVIGILIGVIYGLVIFIPEIIDFIRVIPDIIKTCIDGFKEGWRKAERRKAEKEKNDASIITVEISQEIAEPLKKQENQTNPQPEMLTTRFIKDDAVSEEGAQCIFEADAEENQSAEIGIESIVSQERQALLTVTCPNCGGQCETNPSEQNFQCVHCNTVMETADAADLFTAQIFEKKNGYGEAIFIYNRILAKHPDKSVALAGIARVKNRIRNHTFISHKIPRIFVKDETLEFRKDELVQIRPGRETIIYEYDRMNNVKQGEGWSSDLFNFKYPEHFFVVVFVLHSEDKAKTVVDFILNAQKGLYPSYDWHAENKNDEYFAKEELEKTILIKAVCPCCGKLIMLGLADTTLLCEECNTTIDEEQAINLFIAQYLGKENNYNHSALYYNRVLGVYPDNRLASSGLLQVEQNKKEHVFISASQANFFGKNDILEFRKNYMTYIKQNGEKKVYYYDKMSKVAKSSFGNWHFKYEGEESTQIFSTNVDANSLVEFVLNAQKGIYPLLM